MSCGVLVVGPASPPPVEDPSDEPAEGGAEDQDGAARLAHDLAELFRSGGHDVVECDAPPDLCGARGVVEAAWVVLAGLDLLVVVEDDAGNTAGDATAAALICERARELMTDRGLGGALAHVPPGVPLTTAAACLLELLDPSSAPVGSSPLRVESVPPRLGPGPEHEESGPGSPVGGRPTLVRGPVTGGPFGGSS